MEPLLHHRFQRLQRSPIDRDAASAFHDLDRRVDWRRPLMMQIITQVFGFTKGVRMDASTYSLVTLAEQDLYPLQLSRIVTMRAAR